jgi:hypothetical protein
MDCDCTPQKRLCGHDGEPCNDERCDNTNCYRHCNTPESDAALEIEFNTSSKQQTIMSEQTKPNSSANEVELNALLAQLFSAEMRKTIEKSETLMKACAKQGLYTEASRHQSTIQGMEIAMLTASSVCSQKHALCHLQDHFHFS